MSELLFNVEWVFNWPQCNETTKLLLFAPSFTPAATWPIFRERGTTVQKCTRLVSNYNFVPKNPCTTAKR